MADLADPQRWVLGGLGLVLGAVLWVALRVFLPKAAVRELRFPLACLVSNAVLSALYSMATPQGGPARTLQVLALLALLWAFGRLSFLLVVEGILNARRDRAIPRIFSDLVQLLIYVAAVVLTLRDAGVEMGAIFTTSALLTAVIGLALQETLGNIVAGLAIQGQQPFEVGDWIQFDNDPKHIGQVVEINWRATKVYTDDRVELVVPNGPLAKSTIVNFSKPTRLMRRSVTVFSRYTVAPRRIHDAILETLKDMPGVLTTPPVQVVTSQFKDSLVEYTVTYFIDRFEEREMIDGAARERIWYSLERAHLLAVNTGELQEHEVRHVERHLRQIDFIKPLADDEIRKLAGRITKRAYVPTENVLREGEEGEEMFILNRGEVRILVHDKEVARLKAGSFFGEMSLLTGEKRSATVNAVTEVELYVISHAAFDEVIRANPALLEVISRAVASRQVALEKARGEEGKQDTVMEQRSTQLLHRIRNFFMLS